MKFSMKKINERIISQEANFLSLSRWYTPSNNPVVPIINSVGRPYKYSNVCGSPIKVMPRRDISIVTISTTHINQRIQVRSVWNFILSVYQRGLRKVFLSIGDARC